MEQALNVFPFTDALDKQRQDQKTQGAPDKGDPSQISEDKSKLSEERNEILSDINDREEEWLGITNQEYTEEAKQRKKETNWGKLQEKISRQWDKVGIGRYFKTLLGKVGNIASRIGGWASGFLGQLMELMLYAAVDPSGGLIASFIAAIIPLFFNMVTMFINMATTTIPMIIKMIIGYIPQFFKVISQLFLAIVKLVPILVKAILTALPMIWNGIVNAIPVVLEALGDALSQIGDMIKQSFPELTPVVEFFEDLGRVIGDFFSSKDTDELIEKLKNFMWRGIDAIGSILFDFINAIPGYIQNIRDSLKEMFPEYSKLIDFIYFFGETVGQVLGVVWDVLFWIGSIIVDVLKFLWPIIKFALIIGGIIAAIALWPLTLIAVVALLKTYWKEIEEWFSGIGDAIWDGLMVAGEYILKALYWLTMPFMWPFHLAMWVYKNWEKLKRKIEDIGRAIWEYLGEWWTKIKNLFSGMKIENPFKNLSFSGLIESLKKAISKAFENIPALKKIKTFFESILKMIQDSPVGKAWAKLKGAASSFFGSSVNAEEIYGPAFGTGSKREYFEKLVKGESTSFESGKGFTKDEVNEILKFKQAQDESGDDLSDLKKVNEEQAKLLKDLLSALKNKKFGVTNYTRGGT